MTKLGDYAGVDRVVEVFDNRWLKIFECSAGGSGKGREGYADRSVDSRVG